MVQITDEQGVRIAKSNDPDARQDTLARSALIGGALEGASSSGYGATPAGDTLFQAVAVPIPGAAPGSTIGVLMATQAIDSALAASIKRSSGSDVIFYALDTLDTPRIVASTIGDEAALSALVVQRAALAARTDGAPQDAIAPAPSGGSAAAGAVPRAADGEQYVGQGQPLRSASNRILGGFVALRSRDAELAGFASLRRTILVAGPIGLLLTFLLAYFIAHQITRPVAALVRATRRAADGDYTADITVRSRDEIGTLADAFRAMLADLREKQQLVAYLSATGIVRTEPRRVPALADARTIVTDRAAGVGARLSPGQTLGTRYEIREVLGVGGMGMVYKALDRELGETIAIKTLKPEMLTLDPQALERFKSEIRLARRISHRNVVRTHDLGESGGVYFITMEYVEGRSLRELVHARGRLPVPVTLSVARQLCRALEVAHEQGVIHRDIKSQNIVLEPDGVLKVMDFGIARLAQRPATGGMTQAGMVVGTPEYMAPEQLLGDDVDVRVDIYAAGVVLYECLTGRLPFSAESPMVLIAKLLEDTPPTIRSLNAEVPQRLADVVTRAMARNREERPPTAAALHELLWTNWVERIDVGTHASL